jgi:hypothetical protein
LAVFDEYRTKVGHCKEAIVPECKPLTESTRDVRVRLIRFQNHSAEDGHPAPDPMLLCVKSGVNWSWRSGQQVLPGCEPDKDVDDEVLDVSMLDTEDDDGKSLNSMHDEGNDESLDSTQDNVDVNNDVSLDSEQDEEDDDESLASE